MKPRNESENIIGHCKTQEFVAGAFSGLVVLWPAGSREWALAMRAELHEIESSRESLRWLAGGIMSLVKAWWNRAIYGWKDGEIEPSKVRTPGPIAFTIAALAVVAFFALPSVHQGVRAVLDAWPPFSNSSPAEYQRMAREAEANHDAKTLAFLSSRMNSLDENARLADEAVAMDPSLFWISVRGANLWYNYNHTSHRDELMQKLVASDPDNAALYLTEAGLRENEIWRQSNYQPVAKEKVLNDPEWRTAMEKAFAAPRYDYYYDRAIDLQVTVLKQHNLQQPQEVRGGVTEYYANGLFDAQKYANSLLDQAREAQKKGDTATALHLVWPIAQFAERARLNLHNDWSRGTAEALLLSAGQFLQPLEAAAGHTEVAKLLSTENENISRKMAVKTSQLRVPYWFRPLTAGSIAIHSAGLGVVLFGGLLVFAVVILLVGRLAPPLRKTWLYRWGCNCGRFAPTGFAAAVVLMAATFAPYLEAVRDYFAGFKDPETLNTLSSMSDSLYQLQSRYFGPANQGMFAAYLWIGLLMVVIIVGGLFLGRNAFRPRAPRIRAA